MEATATTERSSIDDVIDVYKKDVDMTLVDEMLKLTVEERLNRILDFMRGLHQLRKAMLDARQ
jgi:hypothetical protein